MAIALGADKRFVLVIDAGHGGHDCGAKGSFSYEKNINLNVALAFGKYVEHNCPDVKVIFTRKTDIFIPLHKRAEIANKNKADVFEAVKGISFDVKKGEIFGFAGLVGAGRTEIVETIFGMRKKTAGQIFINGKEVNIKSPEDAIANSIGLLTEDRRGNGIFGLLDITDNTVMASLKNYGFPQNHKKMEADAVKWNQAMRTKTPSMRQRIMNLSGSCKL